MGDRQHLLVGDKAREVHNAVRWGIDVTGRRDVDPAMPGRIRRRRRDERTHDLMRAVHRPRPARPGRGGRCDGKRRDSRHCQHDNARDSNHSSIVASGGSPRARPDR